MKQYEVLKPECFNHFSCKGGDCQYTCCYGWNITFDTKVRKALQKKSSMSDDQFNLLDASKQEGNNIYTIALDKNGYCPFLSEDKLCNIQKDCGTEPMPNICREFPRIYHKYINKMELGLSLGCERVLELLYEEKDGIQFTNKMEALQGYQRLSSNYDAKYRLKYPALIYYYDIQSLCLGILQAKDSRLEDRMILLGMALFRIDDMSKNEKQQQIPSYINKFINDMENIDAIGHIQDINPEQLSALCSNAAAVLSFMDISNTPDDHIKRLAKKVKEKLRLTNKSFTIEKDLSSMKLSFEFSVENYQQCKQSFSAFIEGKEYFLENMAVAYLFQSNAPFRRPEQGIWTDYTFYVWIFTMVKFTLIVTLDETSTVEDMFHYCAILFRRLAHDSKLYKNVVENLAKNESNSVAHMALFLKSC